MIGISIGGGAPNCPCLYIVQIFDNTPASKDGTLQSGDEITGVNNVSVKGKTKVEVAKMIQSIKVIYINYTIVSINRDLKNIICILLPGGSDNIVQQVARRCGAGEEFGHHPEESEAPFGGEHEFRHGGCPRPLSSDSLQ